MKKPNILITCSNIQSSQLEQLTGDTQLIYSDTATAQAIVDAGGLPIYIPSIPLITEAMIDHYLGNTHGVLVTGADTAVNPFYYKSTPHFLKSRIDDDKDKVDILLIKKAVEREIPILGICKGMEIINLALGGTLHDHDHNIKKTSRSNITHQITVLEDSLLHQIFGETNIGINCGHSQSIKDLSPDLQAVGTANDGTVEAFQSKDTQFLFGVQFHPELRLFDERFKSIFEVFIRHAFFITNKKNKKGKYEKKIQ